MAERTGFVFTYISLILITLLVLKFSDAPKCAPSLALMGRPTIIKALRKKAAIELEQIFCVDENSGGRLKFHIVRSSSCLHWGGQAILSLGYPAQ